MNNVSDSIEQSLHKSFENQMSLKTFQHTAGSNSSFTVLSSSSSSKHLEDDIPPALPQKTKRKTERHPSPYDNVPDEKLGKFL